MTRAGRDVAAARPLRGRNGDEERMCNTLSSSMVNIQHVAIAPERAYNSAGRRVLWMIPRREYCHARRDNPASRYRARRDTHPVLAATVAALAALMAELSLDYACRPAARAEYSPPTGNVVAIVGEHHTMWSGFWTTALAPQSVLGQAAAGQDPCRATTHAHINTPMGPEVGRRWDGRP
jgi:hypothetical protein